MTKPNVNENKGKLSDEENKNMADGLKNLFMAGPRKSVLSRKRRSIIGDEITTDFVYKTSNDLRRLLKNEIAQGFDIDTFDQYGKNALQYAIEGGKVDVAKLLLEKGADPSLANSKGEYPIEFALQLDSNSNGRKHKASKDIAIAIIEAGGVVGETLHNSAFSRLLTHYQQRDQNGVNNGIYDIEVLEALFSDERLNKEGINHFSVDSQLLNNLEVRASGFEEKGNDENVAAIEKVIKIFQEKATKHKTMDELHDELDERFLSHSRSQSRQQSRIFRQSELLQQDDLDALQAELQGQELSHIVEEGSENEGDESDKENNPSGIVSNASASRLKGRSNENEI